MVSRDHGDPGDAPTIAPPLADVANPARPSAAEEARTVAASTNTATLASLSADGAPWASLVTYGLLGGAPVLCVSQMAEHGRNLVRDARASVSIVAPNPPEDPLANTRITLAGKVRRPDEDELPAARAAHIAGCLPRGFTSTTAISPSGFSTSNGCGGSAATVGWTRPVVPNTIRPHQIRYRQRLPARSSISMTTTGRRCSPWRSGWADIRMPRRLVAKAPTGTASISGSVRRGVVGDPGRICRTDRLD